MAVKKQIVDYDGNFEELRPGDTIAGDATAAIIVANNGSGGNLTMGQAVYIDGSGELQLARANADATSKPVGLVLDASVADGLPTNVQMDGLFTMPDWTTIIGAVALAPGALYALSAAVAGQQVLRSSAFVAGEWVVPVMEAVSTTSAKLNFTRRLKKN